jgi:hypothetical protein
LRSESGVLGLPPEGESGTRARKPEGGNPDSEIESRCSCSACPEDGCLARKSSRRSRPPNVAPSPPVAPPKPTKQFLLSVKNGTIQTEEEWRRNKGNKGNAEMEIDVPDRMIAPGLSGHLGEPTGVVGLRGGSRVTGGFSVCALANVAVGE